MTKYTFDIQKIRNMQNRTQRALVGKALPLPDNGALGSLLEFILLHGEYQDGDYQNPDTFKLDATIKCHSCGEQTLKLEVCNFITYDTETRECKTTFIVNDLASPHYWHIPKEQADTLNCLIERDQIQAESKRWATEITEPETSDMFSISPEYRQGHPQLPSQQHAGDAGFDLHTPFTFDLAPLQTATIDTGITCSLPKDHVGLVCPRSGLAAKHSVTVLNAPGIIDQGYTGTIQVTLINHGHETVTFQKGDRIAQIIITPAQTKQTGTQRQNGKHGSTGA